ncbi:Sugar (pentulose or hexulose) kinase [Pedobacter terrae]|uniref:Sugar (Pentulose or hexulose) kinase n=1 Tax=Pedobacter terrae TaxID=405671 RepID=A0A1G7Q1R8_9SPHI|nr:FGGY family carbohydrate kinase [Pedobacter terrae]SDF92527.1 Sugar (pentulose or hexulose) kinase [Pedobacter terrae]
MRNEKIPVVAVFDVGKTNKKLFLFDMDYRVVFERSARFTETIDEDGDPCENIDSLRLSVFDSLSEVFNNPKFELRAINFASYGASLVYIDENGKPLTPLYNYLKVYPEHLKREFYMKYGGEEAFAVKTASPVLGSLNSGMQLYRLKKERPSLFEDVHSILHLPQYLSFLLTGKAYTEKTSLGCHTNLWDFQKQDYHDWVSVEGISEKLAPVVPANHVSPAIFPGKQYEVGVGLHDSSSALIPYLISFREPFVLLSTGTWCISLNPFNQAALTVNELTNDVLCYMQYEGKQVKASRLFSGYAYEQQTKRLAKHFGVDILMFREVVYSPHVIAKLTQKGEEFSIDAPAALKFEDKPLQQYNDVNEAYHDLMLDLVRQQFIATGLVLKGSNVNRIFVDGGFSKNSVFMHLLAEAFPDQEVYAAHMPQATAIGAALAIHNSWNEKPMPNDIISLKLYTPAKTKF